MTDERQSEAGVTLVEMLVVLSLVAVLAGTATLTLGRLSAAPGPAARAETLATRLTLAAETAAVTGRDAALAWAPEGYRFLERDGVSWAPHSTPALTVPTRLDAPTRVTGPEGAVTIRADLAPPSPSPLRLTLSDGRDVATVAFDGLVARLEPRQ